MSIKLLAEFQLYQSKRDSYTEEERKIILAEFRRKLKSDMGNGLEGFLDKINDL